MSSLTLDDSLIRGQSRSQVVSSISVIRSPFDALILLISPVSSRENRIYWHSPGLNNGQGLNSMDKFSCKANAPSRLRGLSPHYNEKLFKAAGAHGSVRFCSPVCQTVFQTPSRLSGRGIFSKKIPHKNVRPHIRSDVTFPRMVDRPNRCLQRSSLCLHLTISLFSHRCLALDMDWLTWDPCRHRVVGLSTVSVCN